MAWHVTLPTESYEAARDVPLEAVACRLVADRKSVV